MKLVNGPTKNNCMKKYRLIMDAAALTKQKMETACKFLSEIENTEGFDVDPEALTISFDESYKQIMQSIAKKYEIIDLTEL